VAIRKRNTVGIRAIGDRVEVLEIGDETTYGSYWFDLRTRRPYAATLKRLIDQFGSLALIVLLTPLFLLVIALIKLDSRGPAVFRQRRIGFRCNEFHMYKFRTMFADAEKLQRGLAETTGSAFFKMKDDPRITRIGRLLRRTSLDELPQLFNVLEGTMSLVGPRPLLLTDLDRFPLRGQMRRFSVRPGITGLWQVSGRSSTSEEERMRLDREYVNEWSLWLDFKIMIRTIGAVVSGRGAT
jgi:lipopolysaccharide/colanic/teichoic acid biosynthesis glycosyltransferase